MKTLLTAEKSNNLTLLQKGVILNYPKNRASKKELEQYRNKEWLEEQYIKLDRSTQDIANQIGCKRNTVQCWLIKFNIKKDEVKREIKHSQKYQQYDYLYEEHIIKRRTKTEIAKDNNVSLDAITYNLKRNNIEDWSSHPTSDLEPYLDLIIYMYYIEKISANQIGIYLNSNHNSVIKLLEKKGYKTRSLSESQFALKNEEPPKEYNDKKWLYEKHWKENLTCAEIGGLLGVNASTVMRQMDRLNIPRKNNSQSKVGLRIGPNHPNWKGGLSPFKSLLREFFRMNLAPIAAKRDNYTCQLCGKTHTILHVHHKRQFSEIVDEIMSEHKDLNMDVIEDRQKMYDIITKDSRFTDINNLITYCKDCHLYKIHNFNKKD